MKNNDPDKKGKTTNVEPKGTKQYTVEKGKNMVYTSLGEGNWEGREVTKPRMTKVKQAPAYSSTKGKVTNRKMGARTKK